MHLLDISKKKELSPIADLEIGVGMHTTSQIALQNLWLYFFFFSFWTIIETLIWSHCPCDIVSLCLDYIISQYFFQAFV